MRVLTSAAQLGCPPGTRAAAPAPRAAAPAPGLPAAAPQTCRAPRALDEATRRLRGDYYRDTLEIRSRCESPSHLAPGAAAGPRHPGCRARHPGCPNLRGGEKPAAGRGTPGAARGVRGCQLRVPVTGTSGAGGRRPGCRPGTRGAAPGCRGGTSGAGAPNPISGTTYGTPLPTV